MSFQELKAARNARQKPSTVPQTLESLSLNDGDAHDTVGKPRRSSLSPTLPPPIAEAGPSSPRAPSTLQKNSTSTSTTLDAESTRGLGLDSFGLEVRRTKGRGRGLFAGKQAFKPGDRVLSLTERCVASALSENHLQDTCSGCYLNLNDSQLVNGSEVKTMLRCAGCKTIHYCSKKCQASDWSLHAPECKSLQVLRGRQPSNAGDSWIPQEYIRGLGRFIWARTKWMKANPGQGEWPMWKQYHLMQTHPDTSTRKMLEISSVAAQLQNYLKLSPAHDPNPEVQGMVNPDLLGLIIRLEVNSFTMAAPDLTPIGMFACPQAAMSNHSCYPNAVVVSPLGAGKGMDIIAIADIQPGEEVFTTYTDVSYPYMTRQVSLEHYHFRCACPLCAATAPDLDPPAIDPRWCLTHDGCPKNGKLPMPKVLQPQSLDALISAVDQKLGWRGQAKGTCDGCGKSVEVDINDLPRLLKKGVELLELGEKSQLRSYFGSVEKASREVNAIMSKLERYIPPCSYPLLQLPRMVFFLYLPPDPSTTLKAVEAASRAAEASPPVYPPNYPTLGIVLAEKAQILAEFQEQSVRKDLDPDEIFLLVKETHETAVAALKACELGLGRASGGGTVGIRARQVVEQMEMTMRMFTGMKDKRRRY